jgi:predicted nucleic acid-binding protein
MIYNKIIFDSCVFIALYNKNDDFHMEALNIFEYYKDSIILISSYVVQEVCTVLTYKF